MIKRFAPVLIAVMLVLSIVTLASARGAPQKKANAVQVAATVNSVVTATVPTMTGYDVIQNITTEPRDLSIAQNTFDVVTTANWRLSPTVYWRSGLPAYTLRAKPSPQIVRRA